jgi:hypothetical protein
VSGFVLTDRHTVYVKGADVVLERIYILSKKEFPRRSKTENERLCHVCSFYLDEKNNLSFTLLSLISLRENGFPPEFIPVKTGAGVTDEETNNF